jgi:DNA-binding transcriptional LysR family regulator
MPVDPRLLVTLEAVARLRSFSEAAYELKFTQSAVSQQISELERQVGARVLDRRPVRPTAAGRVLLDGEAKVRRALAVAAAELKALDAGDHGELRIGAFVSAGASFVPAALARLRAIHPDLRIALIESETGASYGALLRGDLDLAITYDYEIHPLPPPTGLVRRLLFPDPVKIVIPAGHPLAGRPAVPPDEIDPAEWIRTPVIPPVLSFLTKSPQPVRIDFDGDDFRTVMRLVDAALGVAILPTLTLIGAAADVVARPIAGHSLRRFVYSCRLDTSRVPTAVADLEQCLNQAVAAVVMGSAEWSE